MVDRSTPPPIQSIDKVELLPLHQHTFTNGLKVYYITSKESTVIQLSFLFKAGWIHQSKKLLTNAFTSLLLNGTLHHSAKEIAEILEHYGVFYNIEPTPVYTKMQFTFLKKNIDAVLPILTDIIKYANFPQEELDIYTKTHIEQYQTNIKNVAIVAQWNYSKIIYGDTHPLNKLHTPDDYLKLKRDDLLQFFTTHIHPKNGFIFISGNIDDAILKKLEHHFGSTDFHQSQHTFDETVPLPNSYEQHIYNQIPDALQSAIKIGMPIDIHSHHPDYFDGIIANTLLGGFFGSRLMSVIREEKGYTYGIYSTINFFNTFSVFTVSAEVKAEYTQACVDEVIHQIELLQKEAPSEEEMMVVKNYLSGEILDTTDGILKQDNVWKAIITRHWNQDHYNQFLNRIKTITPEDVSNIFKKYISTDKLKKCIVGK
jgi:zinc protease